MVQERRRLVEKFGPSPFSDKAGALVLLDQFRDSEARLVHARGGLAYVTGGNPRYVDDDEPATKDVSSAAESANVGVDHSINYARKAIREITAIGKMRLEEPKSAEKADEDTVQDSDVTSTTQSSTDDADADTPSETHRPDSADSVADNTHSLSSASPSSGVHISSSSSDGPAPAAIEVTPAEKHITASEIDGIAACLTWVWLWFGVKRWGLKQRDTTELKV